MEGRHERKVDLGESSLRVEDKVMGFASKAVLRWRLPDGNWSFETSRGSVVASDGLNKLSISSDIPILRTDLVDGWESLYYMQKQIVPVLEIEIGIAGTIYSEFCWVA